MDLQMRQHTVLETECLLFDFRMSQHKTFWSVSKGWHLISKIKAIIFIIFMQYDSVWLSVWRVREIKRSSPIMGIFFWCHFIKFKLHYFISWILNRIHKSFYSRNHFLNNNYRHSRAIYLEWFFVFLFSFS